MDATIMDSISDNIDDIYIYDNVNNNNMETFGKYVQDGGFLFSDITENVIGPLEKTPKSKIDFDSNCTNIRMTVSIIDDEYLTVDYEQEQIMTKIKERVIDDFIDNPKSIIKQKEKEKENIVTSIDKKVIIDEIPSNLFLDTAIFCPSVVMYKYKANCITDNIEVYQVKDTYIDVFICPDDSNHEVDQNSIVMLGIDIKQKEKEKNEQNGDVILDIDNLTPPNSFFNCYNEENSVNNVIAYKDNCNTNDVTTTSYMFENEDLRTTDIDPFAHGYYRKRDKPRGWFESIGVAAMSAIMILGNN